MPCALSAARLGSELHQCLLQHFGRNGNFEFIQACAKCLGSSGGNRGLRGQGLASAGGICAGIAGADVRASVRGRLVLYDAAGAIADDDTAEGLAGPR